MNQGGSSTNALAPVETNSVENYQVTDPSQPHTYYAPSGSSTVSWSTHGANGYSRENGIISNSNYHLNQPSDSILRSAQDGLNTAPAVTTASSGSNVPQDYSSYATYSSADPYGYGNTGYAAYYSGYQQQTSQPYPQPVGAYQNSGAPYQPLSSFQNTGSYAGPASYSSTYYNPGDYQTSGGYQSGTYNNQNQNQNNYWHGGQYATYTSHQYPSYTPESSAGDYGSTSASAPQYAQHYKQWADYYNQTQTEVSCAPGTENVPVSGAPAVSCSVPGVSGGYATPVNQQATTPYAPSWMPQSNSSELLSSQSGTVSGAVQDGYWKPDSTSFPNQYSNSIEQHVHKTTEISSTYESFQNQQNSTPAQEFTSLYPPTHQVPESYQPSLQPQTQTVFPVDSRKTNKLQIPTNPRIASNFPLGLSKNDKDTAATGATLKPAYISVSQPKPNDKVQSQDVVADSASKSGTFPKSLLGYVERALARCRDEAQKEASQVVMKEMITKATADGTLYTKNWDTEALFPLPNADTMIKGGLLLSTPMSVVQKSKRSPTRRSKSRWEPIPEEKPEKPVTPCETVKFSGWNKQFTSGKVENKGDHTSAVKFSVADPKNTSKNSPRPAKRPRLGYGLNASDNTDASSDSDKEQGVRAYYPAAVTLADTPEEKKRRENRSKRFDKGRGNRANFNHFRQRNAGAGNFYSRRPTALVLSKNFEDNGSKAVEDFDWDAHTVKGTCQEIEKRYLRLTSAPDPATVRPEEILEQALIMVQNSEKNYLYKCDQLKSIRQDLTVQRIRNELTVKVYETHARLAIEVGDLSEYNQCQSQLKTLYAEGIRGCDMEFAAYNLLCVILHANNNRDLLSAMSRLSPEARKNDAVKHALAVRKAVTSGNYVQFFRLYKAAPNTSNYLMDLYVEKMRYAAIKCMSRSYRPTVPVPYISHVLGFSNWLPTAEASEEKEADGIDECAEWLKSHGACLVNESSEELLFDAKASVSSLYMPEPEDAVSHGDASLAVDDFLARNSSIS